MRDPRALVLAGSAPRGGAGVVEAGGLVFVAAGPGGLMRLDPRRVLGQPLMPHAAAPWPQARAAVIAGGRAYLASGGRGLLVFDLADPARPRLTGRLALRDRVTGNFAKVRDDHAYVSGSDGALWVADVSDPAAPRWAARRDMSECCTMQRVDGFSGRHAYVVVWETARVEILDVADPADPRPVGVIEAAGIVRGLDVADGLLWVVSDAGTRAYDLADAAAPRLVFDAPLPAALVRAAGDRLYTIGTTDGLGMWRVERGGGPGGRFMRPGGRGGASPVLYLPSISLGD